MKKLYIIILLIILLCITVVADEFKYKKIDKNEFIFYNNETEINNEKSNLNRALMYNKIKNKECFDFKLKGQEITFKFHERGKYCNLDKIIDQYETQYIKDLAKTLK